MTLKCVFLEDADEDFESAMYLVSGVSTIRATTGFAQAQSAITPTEKLEQEFTDPLTILPQVFFKDTYTPANFGTHAQTNTAVLRAIIPRDTT